MKKLKVFNYVFDVSANGEVIKPLFAIDWDARIDSSLHNSKLHIKCELKFDGIKIGLRLKIDLHEHEGLYFPLKKQNSHQESYFRVFSNVGGEQNVSLDVGALVISSDTVNLEGTDDGNLLFKIIANSPLTSSHDLLPLQINMNGALQLKLRDVDGIGSGAGLVFKSKVLTLATYVRGYIEDEDGFYGYQFFIRTHFSDKFIIIFQQLMPHQEIIFIPEEGVDEFLPLHAYSLSPSESNTKDNPIHVPLGASNYSIRTSLDKRNEKTFLRSLALLPRDNDAKIKLHAFGLADKSQEEVILEITEEIPLGFQLQREENQVASLFIHNTQNQIKATTEATDKLHTFLPDIKLAIKGELFIQGHEPSHYTDSEYDESDFNVSKDIVKKGGYVSLHSDDFILSVPRPGSSFTNSGSSIKNYEFHGRTGISLIPVAYVKSIGDETRQKSFYQTLNADNQQKADLTEAVHSTKMIEGPANKMEMEITSLYPPTVETFQDINLETDVKQSSAEGRLRIADHETQLTFGPLSINVKVKADNDLDYIIIDEKNTGVFKSNGFRLDSGDSKGRFNVGKETPEGLEIVNVAGKRCLPFCIIKRSQKFDLKEILEREGYAPNGDVTVKIPGTNQLKKGLFSEVLDPQTKSRAFVGAILFNMNLDFTEFKALTALVKTDSLKITYLSIVADSKTNASSINAKIFWKSNGEDNSEKAENAEVTFNFEELYLHIQSSRLDDFNAKAVVNFPSVFGMKCSDEGEKFEILGSYNKQSEKIRFLGSLPQKTGLIPDNVNAGLFEQVYLKSAEIVEEHGRVFVAIDGEIKFKEFSIAGMTFGAPDNVVDFNGFGFNLTPPNDNKVRWLPLIYPSISLNPKLRHFNLFGLKAVQIKFTSFAVGFNESIDWNKFSPLKGWNDSPPAKALLAGFRLNLGDLPEFASKSFKKLMFDFTFGFTPSDSGVGFSGENIFVGLNGVGFENLNLDLLRFLTLKINKIKLESLTVKGKSFPTLTATGVRLDILDTKIIEKLSLKIFTDSQGRRGFLAYHGDAVNLGDILEIKWILIGKGIALPTMNNNVDLAKEIIAVENSADLTRQGDLRNAIKEAFTSNLFFPSVNQDDGTVNEKWIFAAGLSVLGGFFTGKFLFQDGGYYGISLAGKMFKEWFGLDDFALSVLYIRGNNRGEDRFYVELFVSGITAGPVHFNGGVVAYEIAMNGGFMVDIGFPRRLSNGGRDWSRAFGAIITPFQGSGGMYIRYKKVLSRPKEKSTIYISAGYAAQGGLGASFGGGIFTVWVRAGIYYGLEGEVGIADAQIVSAKLVGIIGILVEGHGELNFWIISARVSVVATAEAAGTLSWEEGARSTLQLDFALHAQASAHACIGKWIFKVCTSVNVSIGMNFNQTLYLD